jgi:hypothetical protein
MFHIVGGTGMVREERPRKRNAREYDKEGNYQSTFHGHTFDPAIEALPFSNILLAGYYTPASRPVAQALLPVRFSPLSAQHTLCSIHKTRTGKSACATDLTIFGAKV